MVDPFGAADANGNQFILGSATVETEYAISGYWDEAHRQGTDYAQFQVYRGNLFSFAVLEGLYLVTTWILAGDLRIFDERKHGRLERASRRYTALVVRADCDAGAQHHH